MKTLKFIFYYLQELIIQCMYNALLFFQKQRHGFNEQEIYGLNNTIADFVLPRLKAFKENANEGHFSTREGRKELRAMIFSFENFLEVESFMENGKLNKTKYNAHQKRLAKGFVLFGARYQDLFIF